MKVRSRVRRAAPETVLDFASARGRVMKLPFRTSRLGLLLGERSVAIAEVSTLRGAEEVVKATEWTFPSGSILEDPESLGRMLGEHLAAQGFSSRTAVVGVPASWLMAREKDVPPANLDLAAMTIRLQAERDFSFDPKDLVLDYAGTTDVSRPTRVLVVSLLRTRFDATLRLLRAARLSPAAVTPAALTLATRSCLAGATGFFLVLGPESVDLVALEAGAPRLLRCLPAPALEAAPESGDGLEALAGEVRRLASRFALGEGAWSDAPVRVWDGAGISSAGWETLSERLGVEWRPAIPAEGFPGVPPGLAGPAGAPRGRLEAAALLASRGTSPRRLPIDFVHSRCVARKKLQLKRPVLLAGAAVLLLVLGAVLFVVDTHKRQAYLVDLKDQLAVKAPSVTTAEASTAKIERGLGWFERRPGFLGCLKQLTQAFPADGVIWASSFSARENGKGHLTGRSTDQKSILALIDRLQTAPELTDVKLTEMREATGGSRDIAFSLSFTYVGAD